MATKDPNKPDNANIEPESKTTTTEKSPPDQSAPEMTADEAEALAHKGEKAPQDISDKAIPAPGDVVVPFDKINEIISEKQAGKQAAAREAEQSAKETDNPPEKKASDADKSTRQGKPTKPDKSDKKPKPEKSTANQSEKDAKLKKEQESLLSDLDKKAADFKQGQSQKPRAPVSPEYAKALSDYEKELADWNSKEPWDRSSKPPERPKPPKAPKKEAVGGKQQYADKSKAPEKEKTPPAPKEPEKPPVPLDATRNGETEQIVYLNLSELHAFKDHPFGVRDDSEMKALVESVKNGGVNQPALVRPREDGGYEIVAGHRRQKASELAGYANMPCIIRNMTDDEAILAMTDDNLRQRSEILPSEKAVSLKMQVEAIKHQGTRGTSGHNVQNAGQRSVDIVGERNNMNAKQVQRYIRLTDLVSDLLKAMDEKKIGFTQAVELSFIKPQNQNLIVVSIDGEQSVPSQSQAKRMRELDAKGLLTGDVIDGILSEQKKEVDKVIISGEELNKYFGKDKTPQQMKEQIIKLLDDWSGKEKAHTAPEKKADR